jgi:hypothetical protein
MVTGTLAKARAAGQTLMFRVMTTGDGTQYNAPDWLKGAGCKLHSFQVESGGPWITAPDLDDPVCWDKHAALINALGKALAADGDSIQVDIGSVGLWGEWHFSGTQPQVPMPSLATRKKLVDLYFTAFPRSPLLALIGDVETLAYATSRGAGWRADCFGDYGFFSATWNHMEDMYKQHVAQAKAGEAWKKGPVAWESCYWMSKWVEAGYDVHAIFQYGLDLHGSFLNNKSTALPAGAKHRQEVEWFLGKLGYRFVLRELRHPEVLQPGRATDMVMSWENLGVAPCYAGYRVAFRLQPQQGGEPTVITTPVEVRGWLPGPISLTQPIAGPAGLAPGNYSLAVGIVDSTGKPVVRLAIAGREASGWYPLSSVIVEPE